ncbi:hypothetical protein ACFXJO_25035 [Streptomyces lavendulae]|uniref:hypothetical protein n=1 Tax=Streptomyces lavendulae TaxID=1914 RepID=UPI00368E33B2
MTEPYRWTIRATRRHDYGIVETTDLFEPGSPEPGRQPDGSGNGGRTRLAVVDETVDELHGQRSRHSPTRTGAAVEYLTLPGGGVAQDLVGMAASLYRRAIPYVRVPTTLSAALAHHRGRLRLRDLEWIVATVRRIGLAAPHPMFGDPSVTRQAPTGTMRHRDDHQYLTLLTGIGRTEAVDDATEAEINDAAGMTTALGRAPRTRLADACASRRVGMAA